jgi:DNA-binding NarL/FixJ family response regulator
MSVADGPSRKPGKPPTPGKARVLIVDDHPIMRAGLVQLISQEADLEVCAEADSAHGGLEAIEKHSPHVAIVDITLKDSSGLDLIKDIRLRFPGVQVLVVSMRDELYYAERVLRAGARGYVTKAEASEKIVDGIREVLAGGIYVSKQIAAKLIHGMVGGGGEIRTMPIDRLTDRELQVLELMGRGVEPRDIAQQLHLSLKTVDAHREHIKKKLDMDSAAELLKYAITWVQFEREN